MVVIRGRLAPEVGAVLVQALAAARETLYQRARSMDAEDGFAETPTMAQQQADALALVAETALHHGIDPGAPAERYQVVVHVDAPALADPDQPGQSVLADGTHVSAETSRRLACDASRVVMRHGCDGRVVEVAARTRTIPPALRRALHHRDHGCRFPGCGRRFGQGHHIRHWAQGAPPRSRIPPCFVAATTARFTRRATSSIASPTARFGSAARTGGLCRRCRLLWRCSAIPSRSYEHSTMPRGSP